MGIDRVDKGEWVDFGTLAVGENFVSEGNLYEKADPAHHPSGAYGFTEHRIVSTFTATTKVIKKEIEHDEDDGEDDH